MTGSGGTFSCVHKSKPLNSSVTRHPIEEGHIANDLAILLLHPASKGHDAK